MRRNLNISPELFAVLKATSRSFYISLRFLPSRIRATIALAYLLARATDTIADTNDLAPTERREALAAFENKIADGGVDLDLTAVISAQADGPERVLLSRVPVVLAVLNRFPAPHRVLVVEVLRKIIRGQTLDIERFEFRGGVQSLPDEKALDEYTYLVAGSVGAFWTKLCQMEWPNYAKISEHELLRLGVNFGKALQLINIVRDFPADLRLGRSYLPVSNPGAVKANPDLARAEWDQSRLQASRYLDDAWLYVTAIRPLRVRFACAIPLFIGLRTLRLLGEEHRIISGIKVSRREVYTLMVLAALTACLPFLESTIHRFVGSGKQIGNVR
jgi:farnesyl-diphosphate farnesyltransferase